MIRWRKEETMKINISAKKSKVATVKVRRSF